MEYLIGIVLASLIIVTLSMSAMKSSERADASSGKPPIAFEMASAQPSPSPTLSKHPLSKDEIIQRLKKIALSPLPKNLSTGAMCYKTARTPERIEYVCPKCGEKTLYINGSKDRSLSTLFLQYELPECRRIVKNIHAIAVELDEHEFCKKCSPNINKPNMILKVRYAGSTDTVVTKGITLEDIQLVDEFLIGKDRHIGEQGSETPLSKHLSRLQQLLGVK